MVYPCQGRALSNKRKAVRINATARMELKGMMVHGGWGEGYKLNDSIYITLLKQSYSDSFRGYQGPGMDGGGSECGIEGVTGGGPQ